MLADRESQHSPGDTTLPLRHQRASSHRSGEVLAGTQPKRGPTEPRLLTAATDAGASVTGRSRGDLLCPL